MDETATLMIDNVDIAFQLIATPGVINLRFKSGSIECLIPMQAENIIAFLADASIVVGEFSRHQDEQEQLRW